MRAFWIFASLLTFVYIVYYAVVIGMEVLGGSDKKKKNVEVFNIGDSEESQFEEEPVEINEDDDLSSLSVESKEKEDEQAISSSTASVSAEEIAETDVDELFEATKAAEAKMSPISVVAQDEVTPEEYENTRLAMLMAAGEEAVERI